MPIITSAVLGGMQTATGIAQYISGKQQAKKNKQPTYEIPAEVQQNLSQADMQALEGLPPEQKKQYVENIQRQQNFGLNALGDRKAGITGLATLTQQGSDAYGNLLAQDAQARQQNLNNLMAQREVTAGYKDKAFELNKYQPYLQKAEAAQGNIGAGMQNIYGGLASVQGTLENKALADVQGDSQTTQGAGLGGQRSILPNKAPQRTDILNQYRIAKLSNPALTLADFMKTQGGIANIIK